MPKKKEKRCINCVFDKFLIRCSADDKHNKFTGQLYQSSGYEKNVDGNCPKYKRKFWKLGRAK